MKYEKCKDCIYDYEIGCMLDCELALPFIICPAEVEMIKLGLTSSLLDEFILEPDKCKNLLSSSDEFHCSKCDTVIHGCSVEYNGEDGEYMYVYEFNYCPCCGRRIIK